MKYKRNLNTLIWRRRRGERGKGQGAKGADQELVIHLCKEDFTRKPACNKTDWFRLAATVHSGNAESLVTEPYLSDRWLNGIKAFDDLKRFLRFDRRKFSCDAAFHISHAP